MKYIMNVVVQNPRNKETESYNLDCTFCFDKNGYGNKYYLMIDCTNHREIGFPNYDLRYDETFDSEHKVEFLTRWAEDYWSGKNGAWEVIDIRIRAKE